MVLWELLSVTQGNLLMHLIYSKLNLILFINTVVYKGIKLCWENGQKSSDSNKQRQKQLRAIRKGFADKAEEQKDVYGAGLFWCTYTEVNYNLIVVVFTVKIDMGFARF